MFKRALKHPVKDDGYSLLEILVVLAIMALLITLVAPRLLNRVDQAQVTTAKAQAKSLKLALDSYRLDTGRYPTGDEGLSALMIAPDSASGWYGPYMDGDTLPVDPWGNPYVYTPAERTADGRNLPVRVVSLGSDGQPGGEGDAADISS